jgi:hypothetical protein
MAAVSFFALYMAPNAVDGIDSPLLRVKRAINHLHYYHRQRDHQGKNTLPVFPAPNAPPSRPRANIICHQRLGGSLYFYQRAA